jgi:hypothetical protein
VGNKKNKENAQPEANGTVRRAFSISKEFEDIIEAIDNMPNRSRFICEAIKEKLERTKNPGKEIAEALAHYVQIQSIISQPVRTFQSFPNFPNVGGVVVNPIQLPLPPNNMGQDMLGINQMASSLETMNSQNPASASPAETNKIGSANKNESKEKLEIEEIQNEEIQEKTNEAVHQEENNESSLSKTSIEKTTKKEKEPVEETERLDSHEEPSSKKDSEEEKELSNDKDTIPKDQLEELKLKALQKYGLK